MQLINKNLIRTVLNQMKTKQNILQQTGKQQYELTKSQILSSELKL